jgi:hypothetical protein
MEGWDDERFRHLIEYRGYAVEVFTRRAVAMALNRAVVTIRRWEEHGVLCHPRLQAAAKVENKAWWWYTRDQIEDLVRLADQEGLLYPRNGLRPTRRFAEEAHKILNRLPKVGGIDGASSDENGTQDNSP